MTVHGILLITSSFFKFTSMMTTKIKDFSCRFLVLKLNFRHIIFANRTIQSNRRHASAKGEFFETVCQVCLFKHPDAPVLSHHQTPQLQLIIDHMVAVNQ